jgi:hypothetical protein
MLLCVADRPNGRLMAPLPHEDRDLQMALLRPLAPPDVSTSGMVAQRIRRCTYRRLIQLTVVGERVTDVECLFPDRRLPIPLGDMDTATPICNECTAAHIFRPDED